MIRREEARSAADELLAAALLGEGWENALQRLADATASRAATLGHLRSGRLAAALVSPSWADAVACILAGNVPPSVRMFYPEHAFCGGFVRDTDIWLEEELRRDCYFQEFLRPRDGFFHAKLRLFSGSDESLTLCLTRSSKRAPYGASEIAVLDAIVPELRAAFRIARRVLDAEALGMVQALHRRGDWLFELDAFGRVLRAHGEGGEHAGLILRQGRLVATDRLAQSALDRAVAAAVAPPQQPALATLRNDRGERGLLHFVPVTGRARDVFLATAAVVVMIGPSPRRGEPAHFATGIRNAFELTPREAEAAALLAEGLSLAEIAERLGIEVGTARNHLKSIFEKTGARRQGELISLLSRLRL